VFPVFLLPNAVLQGLELQQVQPVRFQYVVLGGNPTTGVLMLIDGHPQFMGIMGHPLPDSYVASDVERVEVIRGPASILYGTNAMGGVINIITKSKTPKVFTRMHEFRTGRSIPKNTWVQLVLKRKNSAHLFRVTMIKPMGTAPIPISKLQTDM
jgi:hypothetical protein